jgi:hypothetical protein
MILLKNALTLKAESGIKNLTTTPEKLEFSLSVSSETTLAIKVTNLVAKKRPY